MSRRGSRGILGLEQSTLIVYILILVVLHVINGIFWYQGMCCGKETRKDGYKIFATIFFWGNILSAIFVFLFTFNLLGQRDSNYTYWNRYFVFYGFISLAGNLMVYYCLQDCKSSKLVCDLNQSFSTTYGLVLIGLVVGMGIMEFLHWFRLRKSRDKLSVNNLKKRFGFIGNTAI